MAHDSEDSQKKSTISPNKVELTDKWAHPAILVLVLLIVVALGALMLIGQLSFLDTEKIMLGIFLIILIIVVCFIGLYFLLPKIQKNR